MVSHKVVDVTLKTHRWCSLWVVFVGVQKTSDEDIIQ
jgi:hypothetical protein